MIRRIWRPPEAFGAARRPTIHKRISQVAEKKETGGSPMRPCEIRRSTNRKINNQIRN
jgi:hypothetical protein